MKRLDVKECAWCKQEFIATRSDARFCCRECLDRWFVRERKQAVAMWRRMHEDDDEEQVRRTG
jgi:DNA-directed RNA polymerase subunit RPC12/RpoP